MDSKESILAASAFGLLALGFVLAYLVRRLLSGSRDGAQKIIAAFAFAVVGAAFGSLANASYTETKESLEYGTFHGIAVLESDSQSGQYGSYATAALSLDGAADLKTRIYYKGDERLYTGDLLEAEVALKPIKEESAARYHESGIVAMADIGDYVLLESQAPLRWIRDLRAAAISDFAEYGGSEGELLQALVCGYRPGIAESGLYDDFKACGIAHVVAVSGAHLAIVVAVFGSILRRARCPRKLSIAMNSLFVAAYLVFAGIPVSAVRAAIMAVLSLMAGACGRRDASLNALAVCILAFIAADPAVSVSAGFFLSAGSTLGILLFSPLFGAWLGMGDAMRREKGEQFGKGFLEPLSLTLSSNIVTLPYSAAAFSMLPLLSPLANVIATPLFTAGCISGLVAAILSLTAPQLSWIWIGAASIAVLPLQASAKMLSSLPFSVVSIEAGAAGMVMLSVSICLILWVFWPRSPRVPASVAALAVLLALSPVFARMALPAPDEVVMLDVGQGDALLVRSGRSSILVDTGNQDDKLMSSLLYEGVAKLDAVVISHPDDDHCGSLGTLMKGIKVERLIVPSDMLECMCVKCRRLVEEARLYLESEYIVGLGVGDRFSSGAFDFEVVWPLAFAEEGGNGDSLCMKMTMDADNNGVADWTMLFTGDAEVAELRRMIELGLVGDVDVLKVGHHGSKTSLDEYVLDALKPELSLISVGSGNRYGHPAETVVSLLENSGSRIWRTDEDGPISVEFGSSAIEVK